VGKGGERRRGCAAALLSALTLAITAAALHAQECAPPSVLDFSVDGRIVRSAPGFTQGLELRDGRLYESTGRIGGTSRLNVISLEGAVTTLADHGAAVFGEGLTILNDEVFQLTWQENIVFVHDLLGKPKRTMRNPRDGWGLTNDGRRLMFTDGGSAVYFADPRSFAIGGRLRVRSHAVGEVKGLNELELVRGKLLANIFMTRLIVRVDLASGCVDGVADLGPLWGAMTASERTQIETDPQRVLNGIAYDDKADRFYLTGKLWPVIFVGRLSERAAR
jgi:glutamine cyclotransferase